MAVVSGRLQLRDWTDNEGNKRRSAEVLVENIYFGEAKRSNSEAAAPDSYGGSSFREISDEDGECPF